MSGKSAEGHPRLSQTHSQEETVMSQDNAAGQDKIRPQPITEADKAGHAGEETNRPGFDLGGAKGDQEAGRGLGLGADAKEGSEDQALPRPADR